jgi:hypothetical protein
VVYVPLIEEGPNSLSGLPVIALDDDHVSYRWVDENSPGGSCAGLTAFDQTARHRILAHWLHSGEGKLAWQTETNATIVWSNRKAYDAEIGRIVSKQEEAFSATAKALFQLGLLSSPEVKYARPKLTIRVVCDIRPCPMANIPTEQTPTFYLPF